MDVSTFDRLSRTLWLTGSRRTTLSALLGSAAVALGLAGTDRAIAQGGCKANGQRCIDGTECCSGRCRRRQPTGPQVCRRAENQGECTVQEDFCAFGSIFCGTDSGGACTCFVTNKGRSFCGSILQGATCGCTSTRQCEQQVGKGAKCVEREAAAPSARKATPTSASLRVRIWTQSRSPASVNPHHRNKEANDAHPTQTATFPGPYPRESLCGPLGRPSLADCSGVESRLRTAASDRGISMGRGVLDPGQVFSRAKVSWWLQSAGWPEQEGRLSTIEDRVGGLAGRKACSCRQCHCTYRSRARAYPARQYITIQQAIRCTE